MTYRPGKSARKMYRHKARYGTAGMSKRQLRALAREMDIGQNPRGHRGHRRKNRRTVQTRVRTSESSHKIHHRRGRFAVPKASHKSGYRHGRNPRPSPRARHHGRHNKRVHRYNKMVRTSKWSVHGVKRAELARSGKMRRWNPVLMNPRRRRNPKRDGTPTRGENRRVKYTAHLEALVQRGEDMKAKLKLVKKAPIGSKTSHFYEGRAPLTAAVREAAADHIPAALPPAVEREVVSDAMHELNEAHAHLIQRLREIGDDAPDDEIEEVHRQVADIAKQKRALRDAAHAVSAPALVQTNPHRGGRRGALGRTRYHLRGLAAYARSLGRYCAAIHSYCGSGRGRRRR